MDKPSYNPVKYVTIDPDYAGQRIDNFLITLLKVPKALVYRILRKGEIRVNKKRVAPSYKVQGGDQVRIPPLQQVEKPKTNKPGQSLINLLSSRILYEDKNLFIINKPSGIPVHGGSQVKMGVIEALRIMYPKLPHLELVHRLDADTSGCLLLAKKRSILKECQFLFREGKVSKIYWALTKGNWHQTELRVDAPLQKNLLSSGERYVKINSEGKRALTDFYPLEVFKNASLMEVTLHTGRTHQIRVHAQYKKHPLAGDEKYGDRDFNKLMRQFGNKRLFLHAKKLEFYLESLEQTIKISAPLDEDLEGCVELLRKNEKNDI